MSGEKPGIRDAIGQQSRRLQDAGMDRASADKRARESGLAVDRKIDRGDLTDPRKLQK